MKDENKSLKTNLTITNFKFTLSSLFLTVCVFFACQKSEETKTVVGSAITERDNPADVYMVDGVIVNEQQFVWGQEGVEYHINIGEKNNPNSQTVYNMAFSTKEGYDNFMRTELGDIHDVHEAIIAHLRQYAQESGAVDYAEAHNSVPQFYLDYESQYLATHLPQATTSQDRGLMAVLFEKIFCQEAFNLTIPLLGTPFFIFNDNKASAVEGLFIGGHHKCYDKKFYFKKLFSINIWALSCRNFPEVYEDRASSWWCIGI